MLGSFKQLLGRNSPEIVWMCSVDALPRVGTVNAQQFAQAKVFCCIRTPLRSGAEQGVAHVLNESGWEPRAAPACEIAEPSALAKPLRELYRAALREGEALKIVPQPKPHPAHEPAETP